MQRVQQRDDQPRHAGAPLGAVQVKVKDGANVDVTLYPGAAGNALAEVKGRAGFIAVDAARVTELLAEDDQISVVNRADTAMYQAKQSGKNRVISA